MWFTIVYLPYLPKPQGTIYDSVLSEKEQYTRVEAPDKEQAEKYFLGGCHAKIVRTYPIHPESAYGCNSEACNEVRSAAKALLDLDNSIRENPGWVGDGWELCIARLRASIERSE